MDYLEQIDQQIFEKRLLNHPFYQEWTKGSLTKESLQDYAQHYYHHVDAFPRYLSAVHAHTECAETRRHILHNLIDEEAGTPNHPELWKSFVKCLGGTVENHQAGKEINQLINTFMDICQNGSIAEGIAALYAYESQIPAVSESKIKGLQEFYNMKKPSEWEYFSVHITADKEHAAVERNLLQRYVNGENLKEVQNAVQRVLDALWNFLTSISLRHGIAG